MGYSLVVNIGRLLIPPNCAEKDIFPIRMGNRSSSLYPGIVRANHQLPRPHSFQRTNEMQGESNLGEGEEGRWGRFKGLGKQRVGKEPEKLNNI